jgi:hypothetical protein
MPFVKGGATLGAGGNPDGPHHHYVGTGEHSGTPDHPDGHGADHGPLARDGAPTHPTTSLSGGAKSMDPRSADRRRATGGSTS